MIVTISNLFPSPSFTHIVSHPIRYFTYLSTPRRPVHVALSFPLKSKCLIFVQVRQDLLTLGAGRVDVADHVEGT